MRRAKVFSGSSHPELTDFICEKLGIAPAAVTLKKFSNRETSVEIGCSVRDEDVFIIQSGSNRINDHLMELLIMISACKGSSASRITAVMPYFPYSKQSKKKKDRGAITAKMVANLLSEAGVDHIITMDLHASQMQGFFNKPVDNLYAEPNIARWIQDSVPEYANGVVVSKNAGGAKRVTSLADCLKIDFALIHTDHTQRFNRSCTTPGTPENETAGSSNNKMNNNNVFNCASNHIDMTITNRRSSDDADDGDGDDGDDFSSAAGEISVDEDGGIITLVGDVAGRIAFIVDDIIDKSASFIAAADHLMKKCNAKRVYVIATHGVLSDDSIIEIERCKNIYQLVITNTFPIAPEKRCQSSKIVTIDISGTLSEAIRRTHNGESISYLFHTAL